MRDRKKEMVICSNPECEKEFNKDLSEVTRNKKIGRKNYCSLKCCGSSNHEHLKKYVKVFRKRKKSPLPPFSRGNSQVSPFQKGDKGGF